MTTNFAIIEMSKILRKLVHHMDIDERRKLDMIIESMSRNMGDPHPGLSTHFHSHDTFQAMLRGMTPDPDPLSVEDRLMLYEWALATYIDQMGSNFEYGLCAHMEWLLPSGYIVPNFIARFLPELYNQKPANKRSDDYWWPRSLSGSLQRIFALSDAAHACRRQIAAS